VVKKEVRDKRERKTPHNIHIGQEEDVGCACLKITNASEQRKEIVFYSLRLPSHTVNFFKQLIKDIVKCGINKEAPIGVIPNPIQTHLQLALGLDALHGEKRRKADHAGRRDVVPTSGTLSGKENAA